LRPENNAWFAIVVERKSSYRREPILVFVLPETGEDLSPHLARP
jgi:hypothetical protein